MRYLIIFLILISLIAPIIATDVGDLVWEKDFSPSSVNCVDTDETGLIVMAGLSNGSIVSYSADGTFQWITSLNGSIIKIQTISDGSKLVAMNDGNQAFFLNGATGSVIKTIQGVTSDNITDVGISKTGSYFAVAGNKSLMIFDDSGNVYASNHTFPAQSRDLMSVDPYASYIVASNGANKTFRWNISTFPGWNEYNELKDAENASSKRSDSFTKKTTFYYSEPVPGLHWFNLTFYNNVSTASDAVYPLSSSFYRYNRTYAGNISLVYGIEDTTNAFKDIDIVGTDGDPYGTWVIVVNATNFPLSINEPIYIYSGNLTFKYTYGSVSFP